VSATGTNDVPVVVVMRVLPDPRARTGAGATRPQPTVMSLRTVEATPAYARARNTP
jgi:hypothetical protein